MVFPPRLITDHEWHFVDFENLPQWVTDSITDLKAGNEKHGLYFRYRYSHDTGQYQFRLQDKHDGTYYGPNLV